MSLLAGQQLSTKRLQKRMLFLFAVLFAVVLHVVVGAFLLWQRSAPEAPSEPPSFEVTLYAEPVAQQEEEPIIDEPEP
ncbi:MAG TPA: hypothetical protein VK099_09575, partial [Alcanivoracaceae bacterium]|nr:hypothetical protein [Alcanivoracaceae bacterium]